MWILTRATPFSSGVQTIYLIDESGNVSNSGSAPSNTGSTYIADLGSDGSKLWYSHLTDGTILELSTSDYSILQTFSSPVTSGTKASVAITAFGDYVYWAYSATGPSASGLYKLNASDMSVVSSVDLTTLDITVRVPTGLGANADNLWMVSTQAAQSYLVKFDLDLNLISNTSFNTIDGTAFPASGGNDKVACVDGINGKLRVVKAAFIASQAEDYNFYEIDGDTLTLTDTIAISGVTNKLRSICGGKV